MSDLKSTLAHVHEHFEATIEAKRDWSRQKARRLRQR
jgi:hypothetical protein